MITDHLTDLLVPITCYIWLASVRSSFRKSELAVTSLAVIFYLDWIKCTSWGITMVRDEVMQTPERAVLGQHVADPQ